MARKTYPNTPAEEAARINAASGDPTGITAEQVANNRKLNESLTASFGFSNSSSGPPVNPFASLVAGVSSKIQQTQEADAAQLPGNFAQAKAELDSKISQLPAGSRYLVKHSVSDIQVLIKEIAESAKYSA